MDFSLTEEQKIMVKTVRDFAQSELMPQYAEEDRKAEFSREQWVKMAEIGLTGIHIPAEYGGLDLDHVTNGLAIEELAKGSVNAATLLIICEILSDVLSRNANDEIKAQWLPGIAKGEKVVGLALTEPQSGSDAAGLICKAVKKGVQYILNGEKSGISLATVADAIVVYAKTDPNLGARGVSAFLVPTDLPGVNCQSYEDMGGRSIVRGSVFLEDVSVPAVNIIGAEGTAFRGVMETFSFSRLLLGLLTVGAASITIKETLQYIKERHAFGKPLADFEGVSFPLAEHYGILQAIRQLCYYGLWLADQGARHVIEAATCKWMGPKYAVDAIHECLQRNFLWNNA